jgi:hypothetical protein
METHIIERNKFLKNKYIQFWINSFILLLIILLPKISFSLGEPIKFDKEISHLTTFYIISGFIILMINNFKLEKIGLFKINFDNISINKNGLKRKMDLTKINQIVINRIQGNIYELKIKSYEFNIVLGKIELEQLESICRTTNIKIKYLSLTDKIEKLIRK